MKKNYLLFLAIFNLNILSIDQVKESDLKKIIANDQEDNKLQNKKSQLSEIIDQEKKSIKKDNIENLPNLQQIVEKEKKDKKISKPKKDKDKSECKTILFNYVNEDLSNVINEIAALKCVNVIFPQPPAKFSTKFTFSSPNEMSINEAWKLLQTILDISGFSFSKKDNIYHIVSNSSINRELFPIYIDDINQIPDTDEKIRFLYFFENISIQNTSSPSFANIDQILKDMLVNEPEQSYILDSSSNSVIITNKANSIKGVMRIIEELDQTGFREAIEVFPLIHTKPDFITAVINKLIHPPDSDQFRFGFPKLPKLGSSYFSDSTKVIPIDRLNSIAILGTIESVNRVKDFIQKNLDQPIDSGKSIIHVKSLEYLDAKDLAPILQDFVKARKEGAQAEAEVKDGLENIVIVAEQQVVAPTIVTTPLSGESATEKPQPTGAVMGGNNLIVAARSSDWQTINKVIDELDKPSLQVAIQILVTEFLLNETKIISAQTRNLADPLHPNTLKFQTTHLTPPNQGLPGPWLNFIDPQQTIINSERGLAADLLKLQFRKDAQGNIIPNSQFNLASLATAGSTIISIENGNGISDLLQILNSYRDVSVLSQPFVVTKNHKQSTISISETKIVQGAIKQESTGGPIIIANEPIKGELSVDVLPRISELGDINLEVSVNANNFTSTSPTDRTRLTRKVKTNANVNDNEILVLGGLMRTDTLSYGSETPPLSKIPIIGYLFKRREKNESKGVLMVFIHSKIIKPKLEGALSDYSKTKIDFAKNIIKENEEEVIGVNFENLKDPITRVFFTPIAKSTNKSIDYYTTQSAFGLDPTGQNLKFESLNEAEKRLEEEEKIKSKIDEREQKIKQLLEKDNINQ